GPARGDRTHVDPVERGRRYPPGRGGADPGRGHAERRAGGVRRRHGHVRGHPADRGTGPGVHPPMSGLADGEVETALEMSIALHGREVTSAELVERALSRAETWQPHIN